MTRDLRRKPLRKCRDFYGAIQEAATAVRDYAACATVYRYRNTKARERSFWLCRVGRPVTVRNFDVALVVTHPSFTTRKKPKAKPKPKWPILPFPQKDDVMWEPGFLSDGSRDEKYDEFDPTANDEEER